MEDLKAGWQASERGDDDLVEMLGAQGASGDQKGRRLRVQAQSLCALRPQERRGGGVGPLGDQCADGGTQGQAGDLGAPGRRPQARRGEGQGHGRGPAGAQPIGQAWTGVLLVNDNGHPCPPGREVSGSRHEAAEADHDLRVDAIDGLPGRGHGLAQVVRQQEKVPRGPTRHRHPGHVG